MNKRMITLMAAALALLSAAAGQVTFTGYDERYAPIEVTPDRNTGLDKIYVVYNTQGVGMTYTASSDEAVTWESYTTRGGGYAEPVEGVTTMGNVTALSQVSANTGYIITEGTTRTYLWVVNYADYYMELNDMSLTVEHPCTGITFHLDGHAESIDYYTITGNRQVLDREIKLIYNTLVWDDSESDWVSTEVEKSFAALGQTFTIDEPPLCNTIFTLTRDRFLQEWGLENDIELPDTYHAEAVNCNSKAEQEARNNDNERGQRDDGTYGGSAPAHIVFTGYPTDAVAYRLWEMATDIDFENVIMQFNQDVVDYTFEEAGTYYMRYMVANAEGTCENYGDTYTISVEESWLTCPNVFSPGTTEGDNDIWKVSYKSLVEFHCWIFNRWGALVYEYTDPGGGWDGTYRGKLVDTGVYYYIVTAVGSDGVKHKQRGDITILRYKGSDGTGSESSGVDPGGF